jgi:hypothetical protein
MIQQESDDIASLATGAATSSPHYARFGTPRGRWILTSMILGSTATFLSATAANVALPSIGADLHGELAGMQW